MSFVVGLGGGIGSGKTAASDRFEALGVTVVDADIASRTLVEKGRPALQNITKHFGKKILTDEGELDRAELRQRIFTNPEEKQWLENLLHPLIGEEINRELANANPPYSILVSPLLVESGQAQRCDRVLIIDAEESEQLSRTTVRDNNTPEQVMGIIKSQASRETRLAAADDVILNNGTLEELHSAVDQQHTLYLEMALKNT